MKTICLVLIFILFASSAVAQESISIDDLCEVHGTYPEEIVSKILSRYRQNLNLVAVSTTTEECSDIKTITLKVRCVGDNRVAVLSVSVLNHKKQVKTATRLFHLHTNDKTLKPCVEKQ